MSSERVRATRWVFTINNFTQEDEEAVMNLPNQDWCKSVIAEEEHLYDGTPHIQGFMVTTRKDRTAISYYLNRHAYIEVARGSAYENWKYCSKEDQIIVEYNKPPQADNKPHRALTHSDQVYQSFREACKTRTEDEMMEEFPGLTVRYRSYYQAVHAEYAIRAITDYNGDLHDKNLWIYGPPGTGKTTFALSGIDKDTIYLKDPNKWWDGFDPSYHKRILLDEFPEGVGASILARFVKRWGDRFRYSGEIKNGTTFIDPNIPVIITSNYSIDETFDKERDRIAIHRRFREVYWDGHNIEMYSECPSFGHYLGQVSPAQRPQPAQIPRRPVTPQSAQYSEYQTDNEDSIVEEDGPLHSTLNTSIPLEYEMSPLERRMMELRKQREESGYYN